MTQVALAVAASLAVWAVLEWWPRLTRRPWRNTLAHNGRQRLNARGVAFATALGAGNLALAATTPPGMEWWRPVGVVTGVTFLALAASSGMRSSR